MFIAPFHECKSVHLFLLLGQLSVVSQNFCSQNGTRHSVARTAVLDPVYILFLTLSTICNSSDIWDILNLLSE